MDVRLLIHLPVALEPGLDEATAKHRDAREQASVHAASSVIATSNWAAAELRRRHGLNYVALRGATRRGRCWRTVRRLPACSRLVRLFPEKNQLALVSALSGLADEPWTARLVGSRPRDTHEAEQVQQAVRDAGLEERIRLTGELTGAALEDQWQVAYWSVLPSSVETYGMVVTESLARHSGGVFAGTGAEETLGFDGQGQRPGFVVAPGEPIALRKALAHWLRDPPTRSAARGAAHGPAARAGRVGSNGHGSQGPSFTISSEETSGAHVPLDIAVRLLRQGELDQAIVGAVDLAGDVRAPQPIASNRSPPRGPCGPSPPRPTARFPVTVRPA